MFEIVYDTPNLVDTTSPATYDDFTLAETIALAKSIEIFNHSDPSPSVAIFHPSGWSRHYINGEIDFTDDRFSQPY